MVKPIIKVVAGILIDSQGHVLLAKRPSPKFMAGYWEFPGGKIEKGETPLAALQRELFEETNAILEQKNLIFLLSYTNTYPSFDAAIEAYYTKDWQGPLKSNENQEMSFWDPFNLPSMPLLPGVEVCIQELHKIKII